MKIELNPYNIGMNFYIILIVFVTTFLGCKTFEKYEERRKLKQEAKEIIEHKLNLK